MLEAMIKLVRYTLILMYASSLVYVFSLANAGHAQDSTASQPDDATYDQESIIEEGADFLGTGAEKVARALESVFSKYGRPNAYITGSEAGGGLVVGLRYGGGELQHKIEGSRPIHWTGPSIGFDVGADAAKVFALVYNVYDTEEIYKRIPAIEGSFYYIAGMGVSVYTDGKHTIAMVRLGAGLRAQASVGYLRISRKRKLLPF